MSERPALVLTSVVFATECPADAEQVARDNGGELLKFSEGRSITTYGSILAAVAAGRTLADAGARVGVAAGDVASVEGDLHGLAMVMAARLCSAAPPGQVFAPEVVAQLEALAVEPVGELELKGIPGRVATVACFGG